MGEQAWRLRAVVPRQSSKAYNVSVAFYLCQDSRQHEKSLLSFTRQSTKNS